MIPAAVGAFIGAACWFTSRAFTDTFAGIDPSSVPGFVMAQLIDAALGVGAILILYPGPPHSGGR